MIIVLSLIYAVGFIGTAIGMVADSLRRFGSEGFTDDALYGAMAVLVSFFWPLLVVGLLVSLTSRAAIKAVQ